MELPSVPVDPQAVLNEYMGRLADVTATNIRLGLMIKTVAMQRDEALRNWEMCARELQEIRAKYEPETPGTVTPLEARR